MKTITFVTHCFNEAENIEQLYKRVLECFGKYSEKYHYEHIFIDNASTDNTVNLIKSIAEQDPRVKLIVNNRNYGAIRSSFHGLLQAKGEAVILMVADLQDPPELIEKFIDTWEGTSCDAVLGVRIKSMESSLMSFIRNLYYNMINRLADVGLLKNFTGFGLYDQKLVQFFRQVEEPYPYVRGLIFEVTDKVEVVEYVQPARYRGVTKNNFYVLYDLAMLGISSHSKVPLRLAVWLGFLSAMFSFLIAVVYGVYKIMFWDTFSAGIAPLVIGVFFFSSVQLVFIGIVGEYLGSIHTKVSNRPHVFERERINF